MKKIIYKYALDHKDAPEILTVGRNQPFKMKMIKGAEILSVQAQFEINDQGIPQATGKIWVLCDPSEKEMAERVFFIMETGREFELNENAKYIDTYQIYGGKIILHLFEIIK